MKQNVSIIIFFTPLLFISAIVKAQQDCYFKPPVVTINFGSGNIRDINTFYLPKYERDQSTCPNDGFYSYVSHTSDCFNHDWLTINYDHTGNGNMMLVNASETGGVFFSTDINNLSGSTTYQFAVWMMNVCRINGGCLPLPPNITISLVTSYGKKIGVFRTGLLPQTDAPHWKKFAGIFITPPDVSSLRLIMEDNTLGGCGNDFALDDITFSECVNSSLEAKTTLPPPRPTKNVQPVTQQPMVKKQPVKPIAKQKENPAIIEKNVAEIKPETTVPLIKQSVSIELPKAISLRANPIIRQIESDSGEISIDLYDNGEIDGDTVSIYHNNQLIVSKAGLSDKPINFHIKINKDEPHHEIVMVAENLGSIPPNTSMMVVTTNKNRYEIFISSTEQKNAKVVMDLRQ